MDLFPERVFLYQSPDDYSSEQGTYIRPGQAISALKSCLQLTPPVSTATDLSKVYCLPSAEFTKLDPANLIHFFSRFKEEISQSSPPTVIGQMTDFPEKRDIAKILGQHWYAPLRLDYRSEQLSKRALSHNLFDVTYTPHKSLARVLPLIQDKPYGRVQRLVFFKLAFSVPVTPQDLDDQPLWAVSLMARGIEVWLGRKVDFSSPQAIIKTSQEVCPQVRLHHRLPSKARYILEVFFGQIYELSDIPPSEFAPYIYRRYFQEGFDEPRFRTLFRFRLAGGRGNRDKKAKQLRLRLQEYTLEVARSLGRCRRLISEISSFADCEMDRLLIHRIKDDFLRAIHRYVDILSQPPDPFGCKITQDFCQKAEIERKNFEWTLHEQRVAIFDFLESVKK